jgi:hypothetical protein
MAEQVRKHVEGRLIELSLDQLRPDHFNPRFPPGRQGTFNNDDELVLRFVDREYDAFQLADSIMRHGYFEVEPIIVMPSEHGNGYTVLEGNRRLVALKGLAAPARRADYPDRRWRRLSGEILPRKTYAAYEVKDRSTVAPVLGFRHITGIAAWEPYAQARYIAQLVDDKSDSLSLEEVTELLGRRSTEVRSAYRNYAIVEQARSLKIPDVARVTQNFGVWTRAMSNPTLRDYIGAASPRDVDPEYWPIDESAKPQLENLISWLFGGPRERPGEPSSRPVIAESREITRLGNVMATEEGLAALEAGHDLESAERATEDPGGAFEEALEVARDALIEALRIVPRGDLSGLAETLVRECLEVVEELRERNARASS